MKYPKEIYLDGCTYMQMYEHEKGGMYYHLEECSEVITGSFISLYPDGRLTYLWNGIEQNYGTYDFENNKKDWRIISKMEKRLYIVRDIPRYLEETSSYCYVVKAGSFDEAIDIIRRKTGRQWGWDVDLADNDEIWE